MADRYPNIGQLNMLENIWRTRPDSEFQEARQQQQQKQQFQEDQRKGSAGSNNPFAPSSSVNQFNQQYPAIQTGEGAFSGMSPMSPTSQLSPSYQQPMATGWGQQQQWDRGGFSQQHAQQHALSPQETYGQQYGNQHMASQFTGNGGMGMGAGSGMAGPGMGGAGMMGGDYGMRVPSQAHAQTTQMGNTGYSAFDPFSPTGSNQQYGAGQYASPVSPIGQGANNYGGSYGANNYAPVPEQIQSTLNVATGIEVPTSNEIFKSKSDNWVKLNISKRRMDLGPPINPPKNFAESYRVVMDQAFENVLNAIASNNKADISTSFEACSAAQGVREMLFRDHGEAGLQKKLSEASSKAAGRRLGEDVRRALNMVRSAPWAIGTFDDIVNDTIAGLKDIFPY